MTNPPFEIPNELRDFAERSVDQARKAFEGFVSVAQKTIGAADDAAETAQKNAKSVGAQALSFTEQNINAALDLAHKLVQAKDPQEAFALQSEFLKSPARQPPGPGQGDRRLDPEERDARRQVIGGAPSKILLIRRQ